MKRIRKQRILATFVAGLFVAASCAGSDADGAAPEVTTSVEGVTTLGSAEVEATEDAADATEDAADEDVVEEPEAVAAVVPDQWLEEVPVGAPSATGWPIAPGRWASGSFKPALAFDVPAGLTLIDQAPSGVRFGLDAVGATGQIHLVRSATLTMSTNESIPIPRSIDAITELLNEQGSALLLDQGRFEHEGDADIGWWEVQLDANLKGYACSVGESCVTLAITRSQGFVEVPTGDPFVIASFIGDVQLGAYVTGPPEEIDELLAAVDVMFASTAQLDSEVEAPAVDERLISSLPRSSSTLEPGVYQHLMGDALIRIDLAEPVERLTLDWASTEMLNLSLSGTDLAMVAYDGILVDPTIDQTGLIQSEASALPRLEQVPRSIDEWSVYADELGALEATGTSSIGGVEVGWFEFSVDPGSGRACGDGSVVGADAECVEFTSYWIHSDTETRNRHFVFGPEGILVILYMEPDTTIDEALVTWQPVLDGLTVSPAG